MFAYGVKNRFYLKNITPVVSTALVASMANGFSTNYLQIYIYPPWHGHMLIVRLCILYLIRGYLALRVLVRGMAHES